MARGRTRKGDDGSGKGENENTFKALEDTQNLGFTQEEIQAILMKAKQDVEDARTKEKTKPPEGTSSSSQSRRWADVVEEGEGEAVLPPKSWVDVARGNRSRENGTALKYVKPGTVVKFTLAELNEGAKLWNNSIVGMVIGASPSYMEVAKYARANWQGMGLGRVHQMQKGVFMFEFKTQDDKARILEGKWAIYEKYPLMLKSWQGNQTVEELFDRIPIWIQLPQLNLDLWAPANLEKVASYVGYPITTDECTAVRSRVDYARVMVEVPLESKLPGEIPIQDEEGPVYYQKVVYEWKPVVCECCGWFGHDENRCKRKKMDQMIEEGVQTVKEVEIVQVETQQPNEKGNEVEARTEEVSKGAGRDKGKGAEGNTPEPARGKVKQVIVSKTPILQNLPANVKNKKGVWEQAGKKNGVGKQANSNG